MARFVKGVSGNPSGKPPGTQHPLSKYRTQLQTALPNIVESLLKQAEGGDLAAIRLVLDKTIPSLKATPLPVDVQINASGEAEAILSVIKSIANGNLCPDSGQQLVTALATLSKVRETSDLVTRLERIEKYLSEGVKRYGDKAIVA